MLRDQIRNLRTDPRTLRKFGLTVGAVFLLLGALLWLRHKPAFPFVLTLGALLVLLGGALPKLLKHVYLGWMTMAFVLGFGVSTVLLTLFFYLAVTPLGLLARCFGKDFLSQKWDQRAATYWRARDRSTPRNPSDYERQF